MKTLLITTFLSALAAGAAELKFPSHRMTEAELLAVLSENGLNDQVTACQNLTHSATAAAVPALAAKLTDSTPAALFAAARFALQNHPDPVAEAAIKAALTTVKDPARLAALKNSLKLRAQPLPDGYQGAAAIINADKPKTALQNGDPSVIPALIEQALAHGEAGQLATRQLIGFPNDAVTPAMKDLLTRSLAPKYDPKRAKLAIEVLATRRTPGVLPWFLQLADQTPEKSLRRELYKSLATLGTTQDWPLLLKLLAAKPNEDRIEGALVRLGAREMVPDTSPITILKAEYKPEPLPKDNGKTPCADVTEMVKSLVRGGARSVMASNQLAGQGGFAQDPAPGRIKFLHLDYRVGNGPELHTVTKENDSATFGRDKLPDALAQQLAEATAAATGPAKAALQRLGDGLRKRGSVDEGHAGFFNLFNGLDLWCWNQQDNFFRAHNATIIAESTPEKPCKQNHHLVYTHQTFANYEFRAEFRLSANANSGVQLRSQPQFIGDNGYQADMDGAGRYVGFIYHPKQGLIGERGTDVKIDANGKKTVKRFADSAELGKVYRPEEWNEIRVQVIARTMTVWINGVRMTSVEDERKNVFPDRGNLALQFHAGPPMTVEYRDVRLHDYR